MGLTAEQRRALRLLAGNPSGFMESILLAHGFEVDALARLIVDGFASAEPVRGSGDARGTTRVIITDAGRRAVEREGLIPPGGDSGS
jgi:hypothetical protein